MTEAVRITAHDALSNWRRGGERTETASSRGFRILTSEARMDGSLGQCPVRLTAAFGPSARICGGPRGQLRLHSPYKAIAWVSPIIDASIRLTPV